MPETGSPEQRLGGARKQIGIALEEVDGDRDVDGMTVAEHLGTALEHLRRVEHELEGDDGA